MGKGHDTCSHHNINAQWCELEKAVLRDLQKNNVHMCTWPHRRVLFVCGLYVSTSLCCWCCVVTLTVVHGAHVHIVDIPVSMSVKWESDSELSLSHISSATYTGDNEFELDRVPLGQVESVWGDGKIYKLIHCRQVVSESNLYTVGKLFLKVSYTLSASCF